MDKMLVLAEKPSVARDIARVLKCQKKGNGFMECEKYVVTWALGHLVTLADPEEYDKAYKEWRMEYLPMMPSELKLSVIRQSAKQYNVVKEQMYRKDIREIVIATDAGREGELVARWIIEKAHVKKPIKRLWISSVTDKAIKDGFMNLKDGRLYENLYQSAEARAEADWLVGINATRALTCKYNAQLSCGRVQTPTVAIIAARENEIKNFKPKKYYGITASVKGFKLIWQDKKSKSTQTFNKDLCDSILEKLKGRNAEVIEVNKLLKKKYAPLLYDLTELQRDANKIFGYSAKETLSIMQRLYETHKILTYPRTDSRYITTDVVDTIKDRVKACSTGPYSKMGQQILKKPITGSRRFVDNSKVGDHHAIIPTEEVPVLSSLNDGERKIYDLVVKRFFSVLYPPFEYEETTIKAKIGEEFFIARGKIVSKEGWKGIYQNILDDEDEKGDIKDQILPGIAKGDILKVTGIAEIAGTTKPPAPFNEATLLSAMENPVKYMDSSDKNLIKIIGETGGLGTVATRADIIEKLFNTFLLEKRGNDIFVTSKGKQLLNLVPEELKSPMLTAEWEQKLKHISEGTLKRESFIGEMKKYTEDIISKIKSSEKTFRHDNITGNRCPVCGKLMLEVNGKHGKMLICQDRKCGYRKNVARLTNARCPECHKKMELCGEGDGRIFVCSCCGHREKLSSFNERKKKEGSSINKREVYNFLKEQKKENSEPINSALADALSKLKL